ncbi:hypothetical protein KIN20_021140 [Parelaphostrongylus tenuis]|uniref:Uncharacterized protein n=1 Tax=Parelaphostrongylus tenuis TaxID=148309 RepID=A0AAD5QU99_PARTN|nr:hypothetical protein KIN20_021140 [Parelaphostrongylus tenuis]
MSSTKMCQEHKVEKLMYLQIVLPSSDLQYELFSRVLHKHFQRLLVDLFQEDDEHLVSLDAVEYPISASGGTGHCEIPVMNSVHATHNEMSDSKVLQNHYTLDHSRKEYLSGGVPFPPTWLTTYLWMGGVTGSRAAKNSGVSRVQSAIRASQAEEEFDVQFGKPS